MKLPHQAFPSLKTASFAWLLIWSSKYSKKVISIILQALQTVVACPVHAALKWRIIIRPKMHSFFLSVLRSCSKKFIYSEKATKIHNISLKNSFFLSVLRSCSKKFIYSEKTTKIQKHLLKIRSFYPFSEAAVKSSYILRRPQKFKNIS